jgi:hypothetical protein
MSLSMMIWAPGRAIRYNLFYAEKAQKRISTSIPGAKNNNENKPNRFLKPVRFKTGAGQPFIKIRN